MLREHVPIGSGEKVYDFGCGDRPYETLVRDRGYEYVGCELDNCADVRITPGLPLGVAAGSAAGVVSFQVLEHVRDIDWYLGECRRLLRRDGWLLLSTHGVWPYHPHPEDYRRWTHTGLQTDLEARGFHVIEIRALVGPLAWTTQIRALGFRHFLLKTPLAIVLTPLVAFLMNVRMVLEEIVTPASIRFNNASIYVAFCRRQNFAAQ